MGLDSVELVLRTEDEFNIAISDDEAGTVRTVGDLYRLVLSKLDTTPSCLSSKAFYCTRRALVESLGLPRRSIRPSTELDQLLPQASRVSMWGEIAERIGMKFPQLRYASRWRQFFMTTSLILSAALVILVWIGLAAEGWLPGFGGFFFVIPAVVLWLVIGNLMHHLVLRTTPRFKYEIPFSTAGELALSVLSMNYSEFETASRNSGKISNEKVWEKLVDIICDQLQIQREEVVPEARFVDDLGVD